MCTAVVLAQPTVPPISATWVAFFFFSDFLHRNGAFWGLSCGLPIERREPATVNPTINERWVTVDEAVSQLERMLAGDRHCTTVGPCAGTWKPLPGQILVRLIAVDREYRWRNGVHKPLEQYLVEWPELQQDPPAIAELRDAEGWTKAEQAEPAWPTTIITAVSAACQSLPWDHHAPGCRQRERGGDGGPAVWGNRLRR